MCTAFFKLGAAKVAPAVARDATFTRGNFFMKTRSFYGRFLILTMLAVGLSTIAADVMAANANWKIGRIYNRLICNECHRADDGKVTSPIDRKQAEWKAYFSADAHDATKTTNASVKHYTNAGYLESIKDTSKAAAKFLKYSDEERLAHVMEFYVHGAKDSDTPARCQ